MQLRNSSFGNIAIGNEAGQDVTGTGWQNVFIGVKADLVARLNSYYDQIDNQNDDQEVVADEDEGQEQEEEDDQEQDEDDQEGVEEIEDEDDSSEP